MQTIEGFDFFPLTFDAEGKLESRQEFDALLTRAKDGPATDAVFLAHGFRNDESEATGLYSRFLQTFRAHLSRPEFQTVATRRFVVGGRVLAFEAVPRDLRRQRWRHPWSPESHRGDGRRRSVNSTISSRARRRLSARSSRRPPRCCRLSVATPGSRTSLSPSCSRIVDGSQLDTTEGLPQIRKKKGSELLARLSDPPAEGTRGIGNLFGGIAGGVGAFLNLTKWYVMKDRSGTVGAKGVATAVRELHDKCPAVKIHLVGHSLGGRLMASCAKALGDTPMLQPDSLMLLEAAFSHYGFSADNGRGKPGFFRDVIARKVVKGPFVSTFSAQDTVVGGPYSIMSRLAGDNTREIGDASDEYGGIGRNGAAEDDRGRHRQAARCQAPPTTTRPTSSTTSMGLAG